MPAKLSCFEMDSNMGGNVADFAEAILLLIRYRISKSWKPYCDPTVWKCQLGFLWSEQSVGNRALDVPLDL
jgi:hypothetical protein